MLEVKRPKGLWTCVRWTIHENPWNWSMNSSWECQMGMCLVAYVGRTYPTFYPIFVWEELLCILNVKTGSYILGLWRFCTDPYSYLSILEFRGGFDINNTLRFHFSRWFSKTLQSVKDVLRIISAWERQNWKKSNYAIKHSKKLKSQLYRKNPFYTYYLKVLKKCDPFAMVQRRFTLLWRQSGLIARFSW